MRLCSHVGLPHGKRCRLAGAPEVAARCASQRRVLQWCRRYAVVAASIVACDMDYWAGWGLLWTVTSLLKR